MHLGAIASSLRADVKVLVSWARRRVWRVRRLSTVYRGHLGVLIVGGTLVGR